MFRRRIKSALYIDFENVRIDVQQISNLVSWLEDGLFDEAKRRRRLIARHVYWNPTDEKHRVAFESQGFNVVLCEHHANLKNGADIRMALDMVETTFQTPKIDEFIIFSKDTDFIPLVQRLGAKDKTTIVLVDENQPRVYNAFNTHADEIIPLRVLRDEALRYVRRKRGIWERVWPKRSQPVVTAQPRAEPRMTASAPVEAASLPGDVKTPTANKTAPPTAALSAPEIPPPLVTDAAKPKRADMDLAVDAFIRVTSRTPGQATARAAIVKQLRGISGFTHMGGKAYLGHKTYDALVGEVAKRDPRITVRTAGSGGIAVVYVPRDEAKAMAL
jgi:uncharacterized LabA/DUF88 family protein